MACNFSNSRRDLDSVGGTNSLEKRMTMLVRRESKISMFKMVEQDVIMNRIWLTLSLEEAKLVADSSEMIKLKKMNKTILPICSLMDSNKGRTEEGSNEVNKHRTWNGRRKSYVLSVAVDASLCSFSLLISYLRQFASFLDCWVLTFETNDVKLLC